MQSAEEKRAKVQAHKVLYRTRHRKRLAEKQKEWTKNNPRKATESVIKAKYGITLDEYEAKLASQDNKCALCGKFEVIKGRRLAIDHSHETGQIRDLLCSLCNKGLGLFQEDPTILLKAVEYLRKWGIVIVPPETVGSP